MERFFRRYFWRRVTLLILPYDSSPTRRLSLPAGAIWALVIFWLAGVTVAAFVITRRVNYEAMRLMNAHLAGQNALYAKEVAKVEALAKRLAPIERELGRILARNKSKALKGIAEGGPASSFIPEEIPQRTSSLVEVGDEIFSRYQAITSLLTATPSEWPVRGWVTSEFGERTSPYTGEIGTYHCGTDIANKLGTPIKAAADGLVTHSGWTSAGYGKMVEISHGYGYTTRYGHCYRLKVSPGQRVRKGEVVAYLGSTGNATGPHLHYEVRLYGTPLNPRAFMK